ncbi:hypothetical protein EYC59_02210 [Candidatus Saccharibacteria bacterium]|nr:MAG: hypothetical protein EYC59_02210 [Candidatus Saccharibacteria bacterium]
MAWRHRYRNITIATVAVVLFLPCSAAALTAISQGFTTDDTNLPAGSVVSLELSQKNKARAASSESAPQLLGVTATQPLVELGSDAKKIQVVVSGEASVLVSDINGEIKAGDKITASPISGIGMKAVEPTQIVGTAQSDLTGAKTTSRTVTDKLGEKKNIHIGVVSLQVNVSYFSGSQSALSNIVPGFLVDVGSSIAGKEVSPLRIMFGFTFLLLGLLIAGIILQAAVRSGIISLGRNPLAHQTLRRGLLDVLLSTLGLIIVTAIVFYLILAL